jgi:hypothetical protein
MSGPTFYKTLLVVCNQNGQLILGIVIYGTFEDSVSKYNVLQCYSNPSTSIAAMARDHKQGRMVEKEFTVVNHNGQMVLLSSPVLGKSGNCIALNFTFDDQGKAAAVVLDELKYLFQFLTLQFWKEQLLIFSDNVSSLSHPDPTMTPQQQCVLQLVQSLHSDSNPTEGVIRLLVNVLTAEDMKRSAVALVQRLYECYLNFTSTQHLVVPAIGSCDEQNGDSLSDTPKEPIHDQQKMLNGNRKEEMEHGATGEVNNPITANLQETGELSSGPSLSKSRDSVPSIRTSKSREGPAHIALLSASKLESGPGMNLEGITIRNESSLLVESRSVALEDADLVVVSSSGRLPTTLGVTGEEQTMENCEYMFKRLVKKVGKPKAMNFLLKSEDQEAADVPLSQRCTGTNSSLNELVSSANSDVLEERRLLVDAIPLSKECTENRPVSDELVKNRDSDVSVAERGLFGDGNYVVPVKATSDVQGTSLIPAADYGVSYGSEVRMLTVIIVMLSVIANIFIDFC